MLIRRWTDRRDLETDRETHAARSAPVDGRPGSQSRLERSNSDALIREFIGQHILAAGRQPNEYREVDGHVAAILKAARSRDLEIIKAGDGRFFYRDGIPIGGLRRMSRRWSGASPSPAARPST